MRPTPLSPPFMGAAQFKAHRSVATSVEANGMKVGFITRGVGEDHDWLVVGVVDDAISAVDASDAESLTNESVHVLRVHEKRITQAIRYVN